MGRNQMYANEFYKKFSMAEGNQHIASLFALKKILDILKLNKPKNILEIGLGIGSVSFTILEYCKRNEIEINYFGTEANEFCLKQLPLNLGNHIEKIILHNSIDEINEELKFDLIIIDGADESLEKIKNQTAVNCCIFIEGDRTFQVEKIKKWFPNYLCVHTISNYKDPEYGPFSSLNWSGGGKLIFINPTLKQKMHYISERIKTAYRYRIR